jgi:hypothetical protein
MMMTLLGMAVTFFVGVGIVVLMGLAVEYDKNKERAK